MIYFKPQINNIMNSTHIYLKRITYNSKLNRAKFIVNKKKYVHIRKFCTYKENLNPEPNNGPNWIMMIMASITAYSVEKLNKTSKSK